MSAPCLPFHTVRNALRDLLNLNGKARDRGSMGLTNMSLLYDREQYSSFFEKWSESRLSHNTFANLVCVEGYIDY